MSADVTSREAIVRAISEFDALGRVEFLSRYGFREATKFFLAFQGLLYDAKAILGVAYGYEHPNEGPLRGSDFRGDRYTVRKKLVSLGFDVAEKTNGELFDFRQHFQLIFNQYERAKKDIKIRRQIAEIFRKIRSHLEDHTIIRNNPNITITSGMGIGRMALVPWIAFLDKRETQTPTRGVYCVFLFKADMSGVYITFNQGVGVDANASPTKKDLENIHKKAIDIRPSCQILQDINFILDDNIELARRGAGKMYEYSTIAYKFYKKLDFPTDLEILNDLEYLLEFYDSYIRKTKFTPPLKLSPSSINSNKAPQQNLKANSDSISKPYVFSSSISL